MNEMRVTDPTDPKAVVRLKLTQGALGIVDIYHDGAWVLRSTWSFLAGFAHEPLVAGCLSEELAVKFHELVLQRSKYAAVEAKATRAGRGVGDRRRA